MFLTFIIHVNDYSVEAVLYKGRISKEIGTLINFFSLTLFHNINVRMFDFFYYGYPQLSIRISLLINKDAVDIIIPCKWDSCFGSIERA
ncbi:hypothetical protein TPENAI_70379 [Tenacibaculum litopenaei]